MRFKLDENLPAALAGHLAASGHDVMTAVGERLGGALDPALLAEAVNERRVFLTFDTDFADIRKYPPASHCGVVVFRLPDQRWSAMLQPVMHLLASLRLNACDGSLVIVDRDRIRRRRTL